MSVKAINDTLGPNWLVSSLLVFGTLPKFPCVTNFNLKKSESFQALQLSRREMETTVEESRIQRALQSKLPPATKYLILRPSKGM